MLVANTFWNDVDKKSKELQQKIGDYFKLDVEMVFVVTTKKYLEKYSESLTFPNVMVITADRLSELLDGKLGRVKKV